MLTTLERGKQFELLRRELVRRENDHAELPTFVSPAQGKVLWAFICTVLCCGIFVGVFVGILFISAVPGWSGSDGDDVPAADETPILLGNNTSDNCTLTYDPDDISELVREAYVRTFFNVTCLATNGTGDPCDLYVAEEYTYRMFSALRFDRLVTEFLGFVAIFSLAQIGGIPRPTDMIGTFFWLAWMATQLAQYVIILLALILQVYSFLGVRARLSPCLVQVDGTALLDFYAMCTFAAQPLLLVKAAVLFAYSFLLTLGMLVFDGSRQWPCRWRPNLTQTPIEPTAARDDAITIEASSAASSAFAVWLRVTKKVSACCPPISKADFVKDASGPTMPANKHFKPHVPLALCHYHMTRTTVLGAGFSMWAALLGSLAASPGVVLAWVLALIVAVLTTMLPWGYIASPILQRGALGDVDFGSTLGVRWGYVAGGTLPYIFLLILFCPFLSAWAILPISALFMLVVKLAYYLGRCFLAHIGPSEEDSSKLVWVNLPNSLAGRCCCKWTDALADPTRACLSWIQSISIFSHVDGVLSRPQGKALAFTSTSYATLAGGISCFWVLLALAPVASHIAWARSLESSGGVAAFASSAVGEVDFGSGALGDVDFGSGASGEWEWNWNWVWGSLIAWLCLGAAIVLGCCSAGNVLAGHFVYQRNLEEYFPKFWVEAFAQDEWSSLTLRTRGRVKTAGACSLFALIFFIFTVPQTADAKERIATTYASSFGVLSDLQLDLGGIFPSSDELVAVLSDPAAALSSVVQRIASLSSYAEFDPAYFAEGVQALTAINLVLNFVKLFATYGQKLFALMYSAKLILKTYAGYEPASEGDDGTVQVYETMTGLEAIAILNLLSKKEVKDGEKKEVKEQGMSLAELVLLDELDFNDCNLNDEDLAGVIALVTLPEFTVKSRSLNLESNRLVTVQAWEKMLPKALGNKTNITELKCAAARKRLLLCQRPLMRLLSHRSHPLPLARSLSFNSIGDEGVTALTAILHETEITDLNLLKCAASPGAHLSVNAH